MCVPRAALSSGQTGAGPGRVKASGVPTEALVLQGCQLSPPQLLVAGCHRCRLIGMLIIISVS